MTIQEILEFTQPGLIVLSIALAIVTGFIGFVFYRAVIFEAASEEEDKERSRLIRKFSSLLAIGLFTLASVLSAALAPGKFDRDQITERLEKAVERVVTSLEQETELEKILKAEKETQ